MNDDELRDRIRGLDPSLGGADPEPVTSPRARALLEDIMSTPVIDTPAPHTPARPRRPWWQAAAAAAAIVGVVAVGAAVLTRDDGGTDVAGPATTVPGKATVLELSAGVDDALASCMALEPSILAGNEVAFRGTVTSADAGVVQLTVDEVYRGVDAQVVTLSAPEGMEALIGGVAWEVGQPYLVSAFDGVVNYCGQSGPATPELQAIYDAAFAG
ncbi:MAG: hypothetical protein MUE78_04140 [Ilumatobacteraceae bacterium]|jgi:hypothetical protein|nr:hypothetical protein [Ilumatobacteraceae bacterium]